MSTVSRRTFLSGTAATAAAVLAGVGFVDTARADPRDAGDRGPDNFRLTVMGTTDLHGNVFNWDYYNTTRPPSTATRRTTTSVWRRSPR